MKLTLAATISSLSILILQKQQQYNYFCCPVKSYFLCVYWIYWLLLTNDHSRCFLCLTLMLGRWEVSIFIFASHDYHSLFFVLQYWLNSFYFTYDEVYLFWRPSLIVCHSIRCISKQVEQETTYFIFNFIHRTHTSCFIQ